MDNPVILSIGRVRYGWTLPKKRNYDLKTRLRVFEKDNSVYARKNKTILLSNI